MITDEIREDLFSRQDPGYRDFQIKLIPDIDPGSVIGVRTPEIRKVAKHYAGNDDINDFLEDVPHGFFDENQVHAFVISGIKDYSTCMDHVERFLPYIDNWATCDQLNPKVFGRHKEELLEKIKLWISTDDTYTVRFGTRMLMNWYLDDGFRTEYLDMAASVQSDEYYVKMMTAWFFATALAKQYEPAVRYIEERRLDVWTHNKTIQKAIESYRVGDDEKEYLRTLRIKGER